MQNILLNDIVNQYQGNTENYSIKEAYNRATDGSKNKIIAVDMDDVLFNTAAVALRYIDRYRDLLEPYYDLSNVPNHPSDSYCYNREDYYITNLFPLKDNSLDKERISTFLTDITWKHPYLYYTVLPMKMTRILQFALDNLPNYISHIYVISECMPDTVDDKINAIERIFGKYKNKIDFLYSIAGKHTKSDILNNYDIDFDIYIEDKISNIVDVIINHKGTRNKEILIPAYGYNTKLSDIEKAVFKESECSIYYYNDNALHLDFSKNTN